jgi:hypothetical protein
MKCLLKFQWENIINETNFINILICYNHHGHQMSLCSGSFLGPMANYPD